MPFDYPGEYAMRFDGEADVKPSALFDRLSSPDMGLALQPSVSGTLQIHGVTAASTRGAMLLSQWYSASSSGIGPPRNIVIDVLNQTKAPVSRWRVRGARPTKWVMKAGTTRPDGAGAVIETLEIAHSGVLRG